VAAALTTHLVESVCFPHTYARTSTNHTYTNYCNNNINFPWTYGEMEVQLHTFLILVLDGSGSSAPEPGHLSPKVTGPGMHLIGAYVDPTESLETGEEENLSPARNQTLIP
jgi:hypothetical protein